MVLTVQQVRQALDRKALDEWEQFIDQNLPKTWREEAGYGYGYVEIGNRPFGRQILEALRTLYSDAGWRITVEELGSGMDTHTERCLVFRAKKS